VSSDEQLPEWYATSLQGHSQLRETKDKRFNLPYTPHSISNPSLVIFGSTTASRYYDYHDSVSPLRKLERVF